MQVGCDGYGTTGRTERGAVKHTRIGHERLGKEFHGTTTEVLFVLSCFDDVGVI